MTETFAPVSIRAAYEWSQILTVVTGVASGRSGSETGCKTGLATLASPSGEEGLDFHRRTLICLLTTAIIGSLAASCIGLTTFLRPEGLFIPREVTVEGLERDAAAPLRQTDCQWFSLPHLRHT